jgi:hypothetical protein
VYKRDECMVFLVKRGADRSQKMMGETHGRKDAFTWAIKMGKEALVKRLLDSGVDIDLKYFISSSSML